VVRTQLIDAILAPVGLVFAFAAQSEPYTLLLLLPLVWLLGVFARERHTRIGYALELSNAYRGTAFLLGDVVEADDSYTGMHSRHVVELSVAVADRLGLGAPERSETEFVALLHDVGKIRIPTEIINKPGALTDEERALMQAHGWRTAILVSEPNHIKRALLIAHDGGLAVVTSPAIDSPGWQNPEARRTNLLRDTRTLMDYQWRRLLGLTI